jgi:predicted nucleotidyltransferase
VSALSERRREPPLSGDALRHAIRDSIRRHLDLESHQIFLFGSEATGAAGQTSDIDVGILGPRPIPGSVVERIRQELDTLRTLRTFDVIDFSRVDDAFRSAALANAEQL